MDIKARGEFQAIEEKIAKEVSYMKDDLKCICGKMAKRVNDLEYKGMLFKGWKCECGETLVDPHYANTYLKYIKLREQGKATAKVRKVGNSFVLTIPSVIRDLLDLTDGKEVRFELADNKLLLQTSP